MASPSSRWRASMSKKARTVSFSWDRDSTAVLLQLCVEFLSINGRKQQFKWPEIADKFEERTGRPVLVGTLRNRMEIMKRHYQLWMRLKGSENCPECNPITGQIEGDSLWWEMKIKENGEFKRFRDKGLPPAMEELCEKIFGDGPLMPTALRMYDPHPHQSESQPDSQLEELLLVDAGLGLLRDIGEEGSSATKQQAHLSSPSPPSGSTPKQIMSDSKRARTTMTSSGAAAAAAFQDTVDELRAEVRRVYDLIANVCAKSADQDKPLRDAYAVLYRMVDDGLVERGTDLFCFAASKILDDQGRKGFMFLESDADRLAWLSFQMRNK
ncbi:hypothetical protein V2J09_000504 [Rumex salicifolius]